MKQVAILLFTALLAGPLHAFPNEPALVESGFDPATVTMMDRIASAGEKDALAVAATLPKGQVTAEHEALRMALAVRLADIGTSASLTQLRVWESTAPVAQIMVDGCRTPVLQPLYDLPFAARHAAARIDERESARRLAERIGQDPDRWRAALREGTGALSDWLLVAEALPPETARRVLAAIGQDPQKGDLYTAATVGLIVASDQMAKSLEGRVLSPALASYLYEKRHRLSEGTKEAVDSLLIASEGAGSRVRLEKAIALPLGEALALKAEWALAAAADDSSARTEELARLARIPGEEKAAVLALMLQDSAVAREALAGLDQLPPDLTRKVQSWLANRSY